jgi:predicted Zn-ribbon and HTH transcriptional regulator
MGGSSEQMDVVDKNLTTREQIIRCLEAEPMTARDLSKALRISEKDAYTHLPYVEKSIRHQGKQIKITPCHCLSCSFVFKDRKSFKKPGKCPVCKKSRIDPAVFKVVGWG